MMANILNESIFFESQKDYFDIIIYIYIYC